MEAIYGGNHFALHNYQINMYSLNLHIVLCQLYLTKAGGISPSMSSPTIIPDVVLFVIILIAPYKYLARKISSKLSSNPANFASETFPQWFGPLLTT